MCLHPLAMNNENCKPLQALNLSLYKKHMIAIKFAQQHKNLIETLLLDPITSIHGLDPDHNNISDTHFDRILDAFSNPTISNIITSHEKIVLSGYDQLKLLKDYYSGVVHNMEQDEIELLLNSVVDLLYSPDQRFVQCNTEWCKEYIPVSFDLFYKN